MALKLKAEYAGLIISRRDFLLGDITFDSIKADPSTYENFRKLGFDLFEEIEDSIHPTIKEEDIIEDLLTPCNNSSGETLIVSLEEGTAYIVDKNGNEIAYDVEEISGLDSENDDSNNIEEPIKPKKNTKKTK